MPRLLKNVTTLIHFPTRWGSCDAYFRRRQFQKRANLTDCCEYSASFEHASVDVHVRQSLWFRLGPQSESQALTYINRGHYVTIYQQRFCSFNWGTVFKVILWPMLNKYRRFLFLEHPFSPMLKNCTTLISSAPSRDVCDALKLHDAYFIRSLSRCVRCLKTVRC